MKREVGTAAKVILRTQFTEQPFYRAKPFFYMINLALTGKALVILSWVRDPSHRDHHY